MKKIYLISDHAGHDLADYIHSKVGFFATFEIELITLNKGPVDLTDDYPDKAKQLAEMLLDDPSAFGVAICGSGQGMCMALNRYKHIRAGFGCDKDSVTLMRQHNDANVLCLGQRLVDGVRAIDMIVALADTPFSNEIRHRRRIALLYNNPPTL
jgi:ribose 5-phosphate isomerase B